MFKLLFAYEKRPTADLLLLASFSSKKGVMETILDQMSADVKSRDSNDKCKIEFKDLHLLDDDRYQCIWPDGSKTSTGQTAFGTIVEKKRKELLTHPAVMALMQWKWQRYGRFFYITEFGE